MSAHEKNYFNYSGICVTNAVLNVHGERKVVRQIKSVEVKPSKGTPDWLYQGAFIFGIVLVLYALVISVSKTLFGWILPMFIGVLSIILGCYMYNTINPTYHLFVHFIEGEPQKIESSIDRKYIQELEKAINEAIENK